MGAPLEVVDDELGRRGILHGRWDEAARQELHRKNVSVLELNYAKGFRGDNLDFLQDTLGLRGIEIIDLNLQDIGGLRILRDTLEHLVLATYSNERVELSDFRRLRSCRIEWLRGAESLFFLRELERVFVNRYPFGDLVQVGQLGRLTRFGCANGTRLTSCRGIEDCTEIVELDLARLPRLEDIGAIGSLAKLEHLALDTCRRVNSLAPIARCVDLRRLDVDNSGAIETLQPLTALGRLESLQFAQSTLIEDGNLELLLALPELREVRFQNRRHYSHTRDELNKELASRHAKR